MAYTDLDVVAVAVSSTLLQVSDALSDAGRPVARIARAPGAQPPWDCEQLVAWPAMQVITPVAGVARGTRPIMRHSCLITLQLLRCIHSGDPIPSENEVDSDGAAFSIDMWLVAKALATWEVGGCARTVYQGIFPEAQQAGFSGMTARILTELG